MFAEAGGWGQCAAPAWLPAPADAVAAQARGAEDACAAVLGALVPVPTRGGS